MFEGLARARTLRTEIYPRSENKLLRSGVRAQNTHTHTYTTVMARAIIDCRMVVIILRGYASRRPQQTPSSPIGENDEIVIGYFSIMKMYRRFLVFFSRNFLPSRSREIVVYVRKTGSADDQTVIVVVVIESSRKTDLWSRWGWW